MIKFFRKIRHRLLTENKFSKYLLYAIGEIILVVIGILIALSINNWNELKKERVLETSLLFDLKDNLERNIVLAKDGISEIEKINRSSEITIQFIEQKLPYSDSLHYHFGEMGRSGSFIVKLNKDGYESYKNIGFEILTSKSLKKEILTLFEVSYKEYESDIEVTNAIWGSDPFWWKDYFIDNMELGMIPIDYTKVQRNNDVLNNVSVLFQQRIAIIEELKFVITESERVLQLIKNEMGESDAK